MPDPAVPTVRARGLFDEFKEFLLRGNLVELAVAVVIGTAFGAVVTAMVKDIITPLIAAIFTQPDFSDLTFTINESRFLYGDFINALLAFVIVAAVVFFLVVKPVNALLRPVKGGEAPGHLRPCPRCLSDVPSRASRCRFCTSELDPEPA